MANIQLQEAVMGEIVNHIPRLLQERGIDENDFIADCMKAGLGHDTARRLTRGDTKVTIETVRIAALVLGSESLSEIMDLGNGSH